MDFTDWLERKRAEARALRQPEVRGITPSIRDFHQALSTQKGPLAVIAELSRASLEEGALAPALAPADWVAPLERASVSALSVGVDGEAMRGGWDDLRQVARLATGPVLAHDLVVSREQVYWARLAGADAVKLHAGAVSAGELRALVDIAASMHLAAPVEVRSEAELALAQAAGARMFIVPAFGPSGLDLALAEALFPKLSRASLVIVRGPFTEDALASVRGKADAVWVAGPWLTAADPEAWLTAFVNRAEAD